MEQDLRTFVSVVERGSFTSAADDVGLTPSAVSKSVARLEDRLGVRMFHRTTRKLSLTQEGNQFYIRAKDIVFAIKEAEEEISTSRLPKGVLRINCLTGFALHELAKFLPEFMEQNPGINVELGITDRVVDLLDERVDVAIRSGTVTNQSLIARKFATFERRLYAAPSYLKKRGTPQTPSDLADHDCIVLATRPPRTWTFLINGEKVEQTVSGRIVVNNIEAALRIAIDGGGITQFPEFVARSMVARSALEHGSLVPVLEDYHADAEIPLYAVYTPGRYRSLKIRAFIDFLVSKFSC